MNDELTSGTQWTQLGPWQVSSELFLDAIFTNRCNRRCSYCIARTRTYSADDPERWRHSLHRAFGLFDIKSVVILGGEATVDPLFWDKLAWVEQEMRTHHGQRIILTTNGTMLTDETFMERLCASGVDSVNLSRMHDDQEINDASFGGPTPDAGQIRMIHDRLRAAGKTLRLNVNIWRGNLDTVEGMERFTDAFAGSCEVIKFSPLMDTKMFDTQAEVSRFTAEKSIPDDEIRVLYDAFAERQHLLRRQANVLGFVDYAELERGSQRVMLKYAQVEDKYDREKVIPTLKLYPDGSLSNEWDYRKDILCTM